MRTLLLLAVFCVSCSSAFAGGGVCHAFRSKTAHAHPLKFYTALAVAFPQSGELISIGLTAARILSPEAWKRFEAPTNEEIDRLWAAMDISHESRGLEIIAGKDFVRLVTMGYLVQADYGTTAVTRLLEFAEKQTGGRYVGNASAYANAFLELILAKFQFPGKEIRDSAAKSDNARLAALTISVENDLLVELERRFPELAIRLYPWKPSQTGKPLTLARLLVDAFA